MATSTFGVDSPTPPDTRQRLIAAAIDLFTRHTFAGTSLQMIADELGFTKAAIYHHFRTREQLLDAVVEPILIRLREVVATAETKRSPQTRAEHMIAAFAELAVDNRVVSVLSTDPSVAAMLRRHQEWDELIERQLALLAGANPGPTGPVRAVVALVGIAGASSQPFGSLDRDVLYDDLVDAGRRVLGLRTPRRASVPPDTEENDD